METGAINLSQNFGVSAYQGRMAMEVLTCVNNLQSRCDMLEDASAFLGCAACCSGIECTRDGLIRDNHLQEKFLYTDVLASAVGAKPFIGQLHSPQIDSKDLFLTSDILNQQMSYVYAKRLRKRAAVSPEEETVKKKGKANYLENSSHSLGNFLTTGMSYQPQAEKAKLKASRPRKKKDPSSVVKVEDGKPLSKALEPKARDEEADVEAAAREWQRCVSLLKRYGVIHKPDVADTETVHHHAPHPGYIGDGLLTKMCKICGAAEDANNTVICDDCQEAYHLSCCVPRLTSKYFKRQDNWFCLSCRKQRRKMGLKIAEKGSSQEDNKVAAHSEKKARLGPAHQADVPEWQERTLEDDVERRVEGCIGMEIPLSESQKNAERDDVRRSFDAKIQSLGWLPAEKVPVGTKQNWVKCKTAIKRANKDADGRKQTDTVCGKWRRAPLNVEQTDEWECFCAIEWDPLHADCAIPQECSDEEVLSRIAFRMQPPTDNLADEAGGRKSTLRQGKIV